MEIQSFELRQMLIDAAEVAVLKYRIETSQEKAYLKKAEAYRTYGRSTVDGWIKQGLIQQFKDGSGKTATVRLDKVELVILSKTSNRS